MEHIFMYNFQQSITQHKYEKVTFSTCLQRNVVLNNDVIIFYSLKRYINNYILQ